MELKKIHSDKRGEIYVFEINSREFLLFFTKKNALRGGHSHSLREYCVILEGQIERKIIVNDQEEIEILSEGDFRITLNDVPHIIKSMSDCWMIEWHEYPKTRINYPPYRTLVEESIK